MESIARAISEDGPPAGFREHLERDAPAKANAGEIKDGNRAGTLHVLDASVHPAEPAETVLEYHRPGVRVIGDIPGRFMVAPEAVAVEDVVFHGVAFQNASSLATLSHSVGRIWDVMLLPER